MTLRALAVRWSALARGTRLFIAGLAVAAIAAAVFAALLGRDNRVPLFARALSPDQVAEVDGRLAAWSVSHRASADNVHVDASARGTLLLKLSLDGVPHAHVVDTSEALQKIGTLTPQTVLEAQTRAGLEGDLDLALRGVDGVEDAHVIVAPGKAAFFADETPREATASVKLTLHPGSVLPPRTVDGIRAFVAAGVPGLDQSRVMVIDGRGASLTADAAADGDGARIQNDIQHALDAAFGTGSAIVMVRAETDTRTRSEHELRRTPLLGAPLAQRSVDEHYSGANKSYNKVRTSEDRGSDAVETDSKTPPGALARLHVAVLVDVALHRQLPQIRNVVATAAGLDVHRGDSLTIQPVAFTRSVTPLPAARPRAGARIALPGREAYTALALVVAGALLVAWGPLVRAVRRASHATPPIAVADVPALPDMDAERLYAQLAGEPPYMIASVVARLPAACAISVLDRYDAAHRAEIVKRLGRPLPPIASEIGASVAVS